MNNEFDTKEYVISDENEIIEISEDEYKEDLTSFEQDIVPSEEDPLELIKERAQETELRKTKQDLKAKENRNKIIVFVVLILFLIVLIGFGIAFLLKEETPEENKKKDEPVVILEKDNYRYENGILVLLGKDEKEIGKYECKNKDEKKCRIAYQNNEDNFDQAKYLYEDGSKLRFGAPIINNNFAFIYDNSKEESGMVFLYDLIKSKVVEKYNSIKYYNVNDVEYLIVENSESNYGLFQVVDNELKQIIDFKYDYLGIKETEMKELGYLVAIKDGKYLIIDKSGKEVSKKISGPIKSFNNKYIVVENNDSYNITDYRNNKLLKNVYDYIVLQENFFVAIKDGNKVDVLDYNEISLQNKEIIIPNEYYNKTYIYDENNKLVETKEAFWLLNNDESVTIEYYKNENDVESKVVNIYEGLVSQNYEYISYYDGVLYIYEDELKTNLLGSYKCINKNNIKSIDSTYNNCYLAKESSFSANELSNADKSLGYLPVINKRYMFINDTLDQNSNNIVLYDLKDNKTLGSYLSIDAGFYDGKSSLSFVNNSDLKVIAQSSRKNKFGVISITKDDVSSVLAMEYDSLERIGNYFLVENAGKTYQLYNQAGEKVTEPVGNKIINYVDGYIKTSVGEKYSVYSFDLTSSKENLDYVELKDKFFVVIDSTKNLSIYNYNDFENAYSSYSLETEEYKYTYLSTNDNYEVVVKDEEGSKITLSPTIE